MILKIMPLIILEKKIVQFISNFSQGKAERPAECQSARERNDDWRDSEIHLSLSLSP